MLILSMHVHNHTLLYTGIHTFQYIYIPFSQCAYTHISALTHNHTHAHTHIHTYTFIHTYTCTHANIHLTCAIMKAIVYRVISVIKKIILIILPITLLLLLHIWACLPAIFSSNYLIISSSHAPAFPSLRGQV